MNVSPVTWNISKRADATIDVEDESLLLSESSGASKSAKGTLSDGRLSSKYLGGKVQKYEH